MSELRECPYCGGVIRSSVPYSGKMFFFCESCFAETSFRETGMQVEKQWEKFNPRATDATIAAILEECESVPTCIGEQATAWTLQDDAYLMYKDQKVGAELLAERIKQIINGARK